MLKHADLGAGRKARRKCYLQLQLDVTHIAAPKSKGSRGLLLPWRLQGHPLPSLVHDHRWRSQCSLRSQWDWEVDSLHHFKRTTCQPSGRTGPRTPACGPDRKINATKGIGALAEPFFCCSSCKIGAGPDEEGRARCCRNPRGRFLLPVH